MESLTVGMVWQSDSQGWAVSTFFFEVNNFEQLLSDWLYVDDYQHEILVWVNP